MRGRADHRRARLLRAAIAAVPSLGAVMCWTWFGSLNREIAQSVEYSLGTSAGWHQWLERGEPGEIIRRLGVPIYDQWSGLGYRLPTQGMLSDTPLSYLALFLPINFVMFVAFIGALWFAFVLVHQWIDTWTKKNRMLTYLIVDMAIIGMISFYTLWHGWQTYIIQIAGALVILTTLTRRDVVETPHTVDPVPFTSCLAAGLFLLMAPHFGYAMTYAPALLVLFFSVTLSHKAVLFVRMMREPKAFVVPVLILFATLPYVLDLLREMALQSLRPDYLPEPGVLDFAIRQGGILEASAPLQLVFGVILLAHTFVFPLVALFDPGAYSQTGFSGTLTLSWNASAWPIRVVQFHGGLLAVCLALWVMRRPSRQMPKLTQRLLVAMLVVSTLIALLNTSQVSVFTLNWFPVWLLSNSRWTHSDLSLLLCLVLFVWKSDDLWRLLFAKSHRVSWRRRVFKVGVIVGLLSVICVLPYRLSETVRLNGMQTRFSSLQVDSRTRAENEEWRTVVLRIREDMFGTADVGPQRVMFEGEGLMGAEGDNAWFGLRTHSQLRDVQLSSLLSWPRLRSGETLTRGDKFQHIVSDPVCDSSLRSRLDFLAVAWSVISTDCAETALRSESSVAVPMPPSWTSTRTNRSLSSIMPEMIARTPLLSQGDVSAVRLSSFHQWWSTSDHGLSEYCPMLVEHCIDELGLIQGSMTSTPPLVVCLEECMATYEVTEVLPSSKVLVVPLNYDSSLRAVQGSTSLTVSNFHGLVAIPASQLIPGQIKFSVKPDIIMRLRSLAPLALIAALVVAYLQSFRAGTLVGIVSRRKSDAPS